jgi:hypothetical protein
MQLNIMKESLSLLESAKKPNTIGRSKLIWSEDNAWRDNYAEVTETNRTDLARRGEARRNQQATEKAGGKKRAPMIAEM